jgi:hypothetical protein
MTSQNPKKQTFFKPQIPEEAKSKSIEETVSLDSMCLLDWVPTEIAKYAYTQADLKLRIESDEPEWSFHAPFMANQYRYGIEAVKAIKRGDVKKAVESYMGYIYNQMEFTRGISRIQNNVLLNRRELDSMLRTRLTGYEVEILEFVKSLDVKISDETLQSWILSLRQDKKDYWSKVANSVQEPKEEVYKIREFARSKKWFGRAHLIDYRLKEDKESVKDSLGMINTYTWSCPKCQLNMLHEGVETATKIRDDSSLEKMIRIYAEKQHLLDGKFGIIYGVLPGWFREGQEYDSDKKEFKEGYTDAKPLFIQIADMWEVALSTEDKLYAVTKMKPLIKIDEENVRKFHKDWKERGYLSKDFEAVCQSIGINLWES